MSLLFFVFISIILLIFGYFIYGSFLAKLFKLSSSNKTPANKINDGIDFVSTVKSYLLGQHLSAIAAAGPIVGPILAGMWFGWLPTIIWIVLGAIFIGGVHDFSSLVASLRYGGKSIAEVIKDNMSRRAFILFLLFLWFSLIYIITAFTDITAGTFIDPVHGGAVASASMMYLGIALIMGLVLRIFKAPLGLSTAIFLPLVFLCIHLGNKFPLWLTPFFGLDTRTLWNIFLIVYCFIASIIPVWLLLQPRGYLGGFFLIITAGLSFIGLIIGSFTQNYTISYPVFTGWVSPQGLPLLPILFTTVACGACSGFHAIVSSGTTSKQVACETDAKVIGYGGMLLESFVAIIALGTLLLLTKEKAIQLKDPNQIYASGIASFLNNLGINREFALNFALLAFATFVYDTLDVATRLGRYIFEELIGLKNKFTPYLASFVTLIFPMIFVTAKMTDAAGNPVSAWKVFWTVFGSSNQLLASLVLLGISVWLFKNKIRYLVTLIPAIFMMIVAISSLYLILKPALVNFSLKDLSSFQPMTITCLILLVLTVLLIFEGVKIFIQQKTQPNSGKA